MFFPDHCIGCRAELSNNGILCTACLAGIPTQSAFFCSKCRRRIPIRDGRVKKCICENSFIVGTAVSYNFQAVSELIKILKYRGLQAPGALCGNFLANFVKSAGLETKNFTVIPLPLGTQRERKRGFNQAALIAERFCSNLGIEDEKYCPNALKRIRNTVQQTSMRSFEARSRNVKNCFALTGKASLKGKNILLIDDVYTSGATSGEAVQVLQKAGARTIVVLAVAHG